jgi:hypothetical protein
MLVCSAAFMAMMPYTARVIHVFWLPMVLMLMTEIMTTMQIMAAMEVIR